MLPLRLIPDGSLPTVDVIVCGGARGGVYVNAANGVYVAASNSCGRLRITDPSPNWVMEYMPTSRVMPDMLLLPTGAVIILNGAANGTAG
ncbi:hypothetical protein RD792_012531 [Penstemon davidsonii]|uniref:Glyoxal oxidase N-terminal domain-containing protein n=1 Tax=Penstemon davidsonii TaxID=160366 RepID=A0ABR0CX50_9LAMI|nr:hypothetical protein RD792_012531 [Penstemon davidsonii]